MRLLDEFLDLFGRLTSFPELTWEGGLAVIIFFVGLVLITFALGILVAPILLFVTFVYQCIRLSLGKSLNKTWIVLTIVLFVLHVGFWVWMITQRQGVLFCCGRDPELLLRGILFILRSRVQYN